MDDELDRVFEDAWNAGWQAAVEAVRTFLVDVDADQLDDREVAPNVDTCQPSVVKPREGATVRNMLFVLLFAALFTVAGCAPAPAPGTTTSTTTTTTTDPADVTPPRVTIGGPACVSWGYTGTFTATATDSSGVQSTRLSWAGATSGSKTGGATVTASVTMPQPAVQLLFTATATDNAGNTASVTRTVGGAPACVP